jgi:hypothetical protein
MSKPFGGDTAGQDRNMQAEKYGGRKPCLFDKQMRKSGMRGAG